MNVHKLIIGSSLLMGVVEYITNESITKAAMISIGWICAFEALNLLIKGDDCDG